MEIDWGTLAILSLGTLAVLLRIKGGFDIFAWFSKWFELRTRERKIKELEELEKIRKTNFDEIAKLIEIKVTFLQHRLSDSAPKIDLGFTIYNRSVYDINLSRFTYKPYLPGVPGSELEQKEGYSNLIIPKQGANQFNTFFQITDKIKDQLIEWRKKGEAGRQASFNWSFGCVAKFIKPKELELPVTVTYTQEYYQI